MSYTYAAARNRDGARVNTRVPTRMFQLVTKYQLTGALKGLSIGGGVDWKNDMPFFLANPVSGVMEDGISLSFDRGEGAVAFALAAVAADMSRP